MTRHVGSIIPDRTQHAGRSIDFIEYYDKNDLLD
jgi:hypothetical protein